MGTMGTTLYSHRVWCCTTSLEKESRTNITFIESVCIASQVNESEQTMLGTESVCDFSYIDKQGYRHQKHRQMSGSDTWRTRK